MVPKLYMIAKDGHLKVTEDVYLSFISQPKPTRWITKAMYTMDYECYTIDYDDGAKTNKIHKGKIHVCT